MLLSACLALLAVRPTVAQAKPALPPLSDEDGAARMIFERTASTGMVIVLVRDGEVWMQSYGQTRPGSGQKPAANALIRLCSLTKVLTTDLLVKLVADGKVSFMDPLQKFAPDGATVPTMTVHGPALRALTLGDLATHTAGVPREIAYPPKGEAHFTFPDEAFRWQWLPGFRLRVSPGTAAHYSNVGFDLLADALSQATRKPYALLFADRTAKPLGLTDTTLTPTPNQCERLMGGAREPIDCTDTTAAGGSGGMYSTPNDMVRWLKYLLGLPGVPVHQLGMATAMYVQPEHLRSMQGLGHAGVPTGIGLGWLELQGADSPQRIVEKTGGGAGFQTYLALSPSHHAGVFVALTQGRGRSGANMFREANDLLMNVAGLPPLPKDLNDPERERDPEEEAETPAVGGRSRAATVQVAAGPRARRVRSARKAGATRKARR